ncbi:hypothetical protein SAMN04488543_2655 [Friedmanniella luteola]|uniref:Small integral membrane protein n=1 Tax=Friedmanniella luteola TaxID=546871 RepID=A0A1H1W602_9ACTN|nr:hypothetical protein [Friedmanniella luteola]SDS92513.1 hypothetical protein SAMN04488543_2655 [Friedmanniella luteola]
MSSTQTAVLVGLVLGVVVAFGGFGPFVVVVLFGAVGLVIGRVLEGKLDVRALVSPADRR